MTPEMTHQVPNPTNHQMPTSGSPYTLYGGQEQGAYLTPAVSSSSPDTIKQEMTSPVYDATTMNNNNATAAHQQQHHHHHATQQQPIHHQSTAVYTPPLGN